jgi:hypothetical protein
MISWNIWILFFGYTVPMVVSPGPGNTVLATAGGRFGVAGSLPFWAGFEMANVALCLIYGMGLGKALHGHPEIQACSSGRAPLICSILPGDFFVRQPDRQTAAKRAACGFVPGTGFYP